MPILEKHCLFGLISADSTAPGSTPHFHRIFQSDPIIRQRPIFVKRIPAHALEKIPQETDAYKSIIALSCCF